MVSRYEGSVIIGYDFRKFDEFVIPLGVAARRTAAGGGTHQLSSRPRVCEWRGEPRAFFTSVRGTGRRSKSCGTTSWS